MGGNTWEKWGEVVAAAQRHAAGRHEKGLGKSAASRKKGIRKKEEPRESMSLGAVDEGSYFRTNEQFTKQGNWRD